MTDILFSVDVNHIESCSLKKAYLSELKNKILFFFI